MKNTGSDCADGAIATIQQLTKCRLALSSYGRVLFTVLIGVELAING